jgi:hypothetical protein
LDQTGFLDEIIASATNIYEGRRGLDTDGSEHEGRVNYRSSLAVALDTFQQVRMLPAEDLELLVLAEYTFLGQEHKYCDSRDTRALISLKKAIQEFDEAFLALGILQNAVIYQSVEKTYSTRAEFRYKGMPKDAFHVACAGHKARLDNMLKVPGINLAEKELLKQRYANMIRAQLVYWEKQKGHINDARPVP